jgi:hypothetical protein
LRRAPREKARRGAQPKAALLVVGCTVEAAV